MKALVVYESMFGNTRQIAEAVARGLGNHGEVRAVEVGEAPADLSGYDFLVVGGPTHILGMSRPMTRKGAADQAQQHGMELVSKGEGVREWLGGVTPPRRDYPAASFDTALRKLGWFGAGSAARKEASVLEEKGFRMVAPPEQFRVTGGEIARLEPGELERAEEWGRALAAAYGAA